MRGSFPKLPKPRVYPRVCSIWCRAEPILAERSPLTVAVPEIRTMQDRFLDELLVARNLAWMSTLNRELSKGNAFVGVGALHLIGDQGLVALLRAEGYTVTLLAN